MGWTTSDFTMRASLAWGNREEAVGGLVTRKEALEGDSIETWWHGRWEPGSLHSAVRRAERRHAGKSWAAPAGMTELL